MIKKVLKIFIPTKYYNLLTSTKEYLYDIKRFVKHSNNFQFLDTQTKFDGYLTMKYHIIEKGLSMPETRLGFGAKVINELVSLCDTYSQSNFDKNSQAYFHTKMVLRDYLKYHIDHGFELEEAIKSSIERVTSVSEKDEYTSFTATTATEYFKYSNAAFSEFFVSRHSMRNFTDEEISVEVMRDCIKTATKSPSPCNRQPNRVYIINDKETILEALKLQNGNRGFGHLSASLLVITADVSVFQNNKERNEAAFSSGLFSMSLILALHQKKIGTCLLNWSSDKENDQKLRKLLNIPDSQMISVLIAAGHLPEKFKYANSPRKNPEEITYFIEK